MAQGIVKSRPAKSSATGGSGSSSTKSNSRITKKGARTITPKNSKLLKQQKMTKKFSAGLITQTERMLGAKAGHLEMLGPGRKKGGDGNGGKGAKESVKGKGRAKGAKKT